MNVSVVRGYDSGGLGKLRLDGSKGRPDGKYKKPNPNMAEGHPNGQARKVLAGKWSSPSRRA